MVYGANFGMMMPGMSFMNMTPSAKYLDGWQFSYFDGMLNGAGKSTMTYPVDTLSVTNDAAIRSFVDSSYSVLPQTNFTMNGVMQQFRNWMQEYNTRFQEIMEKIADDRKKADEKTQVDQEEEIDPTHDLEETPEVKEPEKPEEKEKVITEEDCIKSLEEMTKNITALHNEKIYGPDGDKTLGEYLQDLISEYKDSDVKDKKLCDENYNKILDIAKKYIEKTDGLIDDKDLETLKKIANKPGTPWNKKVEKQEEKPKTSYRDTLEDPLNFDIQNERLAKALYAAMDGPGTWIKDFNNAMNEIDEKNVVEVMETYKENYAPKMKSFGFFGSSDYNLIDSIIDDFSGDELKGHLTHLKDALVNRAKALTDTVDEDGNEVENAKVTEFKNTVASLIGKDDDTSKDNLIKAFEKFKDFIREMEGTTNKRIILDTNATQTA